MQARVRDRAGVTLESVEAQFRRWRRARDGYGRIPHELWRAAAEAAAAYGVQETAARLQLDAGKLRRWMRTLRGPVGQPTGPAESAKPAERPQFVELAPLAIAPPECTLEIEDPSGRRLRISLKGQAIGQAAELSQMLWRVQS